MRRALALALACVLAVELLGVACEVPYGRLDYPGATAPDAGE